MRTGERRPRRRKIEDETTLVAEPAPDADALARAMYASYLDSNFSEALVLGEHVVAQRPDHALAHAVVSRCRAVLGDGTGTRLRADSVVRLRADATTVDEQSVGEGSMAVLQHLDGLTNAATIADLAGIPRLEALEHLLALLEVGVIEVVA